MTWQALNHIGSQYGAPDIDYDRFAKRWESDPILKKLVSRFDGHGVVIATAQGEEQPNQGEPEEKGAKAVDRAAMNATKRAMKS